MLFGKKFLATLAATACLTFGATTAQAADYPSADEVAVKVANSGGTFFPVGKPNVAYEKYFTGQTFLAPLSTKDSINVANVTFIDGAHTFWHIHHGTNPRGGVGRGLRSNLGSRSRRTQTRRGVHRPRRRQALARRGSRQNDATLVNNAGKPRSLDGLA